MGRFDAKYSTDMKDAIARAVIERKMTPREAIAAAKAGELPGHREPFDMTLSSAQHVARQERRRRAGRELTAKQQGSPDDRLELLVGRQLAMIEHATTLMERKARGNRFAAEDLEKGRKLTAWTREAQALVGRVAPSKHTGRAARKTEAAGEPSSATESAAAQPSGLVAQMTRDHRERPPEQAPVPTPAPLAFPSTPPTPRRNETAQERSEGRAGA
jgi:hypothetical protein